MLAAGVQSSLARGLEQWLWFLGLDVLYAKNNLLLKNGFVKYKPPETKGSSLYRRAWKDYLIELHSFCVGAYSEDDDGFIFIRARRQCFLYTSYHPARPGLYSEEDLQLVKDKETSVRFYKAAVRFLDWLIEYERWIDRFCERGYRDKCYKAYHMKWLPPSEGLEWLHHFCENPSEAGGVQPVTPNAGGSMKSSPIQHPLQKHPVPPNVLHRPSVHR